MVCVHPQCFLDEFDAFSLELSHGGKVRVSVKGGDHASFSTLLPRNGIGYPPGSFEDTQYKDAMIRDGALLWIYNHCPGSFSNNIILQMRDYIFPDMTLNLKTIGDFVVKNSYYLIEAYLKMKKNTYLLPTDPKIYCKCCDKYQGVSNGCHRCLREIPTDIIESMSENEYELINFLNNECGTIYSTPSNREYRSISIDPKTRDRIIIIGEDSYICRAKALIDTFLRQFKPLLIGWSTDLEPTPFQAPSPASSPAPSPATAPVPCPVNTWMERRSTHMNRDRPPAIVVAEAVKNSPNYKGFVDLMESGKIHLSIRSLDTGISYGRFLLKDDDFWTIHKNKFQNNFGTLFQILEKMFLNLDGLFSWNIEDETDELIYVRFICEGIMGFDITIEIPRREDDISILKKQNKALEQRVTELERVINLMIPKTIFNPDEWMVDHYENQKDIIKNKMKVTGPQGEINTTHHADLGMITFNESNYQQSLRGHRESMEIRENNPRIMSGIGYTVELSNCDIIAYCKGKLNIKL